MQEDKIKDIWKKVLGDVETEVSHAHFLTLFKNTSLVSLEENTATVSTTSNMIVDLLKKRFCLLIKNSLDKHTKQDVKIVFTIKSNKLKVDPGPLFAQEESLILNKPSLTNKLARVREDFTFETMAVSSSNQLAFVSAQKVAKNPGKTYNPLFIYGPVGVGKTHLMQAVANAVFKQDSSKNIIYISSEEFTNEVVEAIRTNNTSRMKKRFRSTDVLIIDDVQFIAGKDRVQEELFHTFNILIDKSSQVVLSSDRPPQEIKKLENRLSSRFSSGLTVDVEPPDFELRTAVLLIKAKRRNINLSIEAAKKLAEKAQDIRTLEGLLLRVITQAGESKEEITEDLVNEALKTGQENQRNILHPDEIIKSVCNFYNIKLTQIKSPKRDASLVKARQIAMYLLQKELKLTLVEIGNLLGGRDHTTIMHGVEKIEKALSLPSENQHLNSEILGISKSFS